MAHPKANATSFKKGYDPKRFVRANNGLVNYHQNLSNMLSERSFEAVEYMYKVLNDDKAPTALRMRAAEDILNRAHGKPVDRTVVATVDAQGDQGNMEQLSDNQLLRLIKKLDNKVIDVKPDK